VPRRGRDWPKWLWLAEFAYNHAVQASTGFSPFQLMYGENPCTPLERMLPTVHKSPQVKQLLDKLRQTLETCKKHPSSCSGLSGPAAGTAAHSTSCSDRGHAGCPLTEHLKLPGKTARKLEGEMDWPCPYHTCASQWQCRGAQSSSQHGKSPSPGM
jgi:hypothetical protein